MQKNQFSLFDFLWLIWHASASIEKGTLGLSISFYRKDNSCATKVLPCKLLYLSVLSFVALLG
jgi:hypothetical protein